MLPSLLLLPFLGGLTTAAFYLLVQCHTSAAGAPTCGLGFAFGSWLGLGAR
jgi:hypothetical protein